MLTGRNAEGYTDFITSCTTCQQVKYIPKAAADCYAIKTPNQVWEDLSMDFIVRLLAFNNNTVTMVIVDRFCNLNTF